MIKFSNVRLLVKDYAACFEFYAGQLGLEPLWGDTQSGYASFKVAEGIEGLALFGSDLMAEFISNSAKPAPIGCREKSLISFSVDNVDETFRALSAQGVKFINEPTDMPAWGMRVVHLYDPEENLIEFFTPLAQEQWDKELQEESSKYV